MHNVKPGEQLPFVTNDRSAAERDGRRRSGEQQIEYFLGVREFVNGDVEYIVARMDDFRALHDSGGWLHDVTYGRPMDPNHLTAAYVCCDIGEAMLDATERIIHGSPSLFIGSRDGAYLVAPMEKWPRFSAVGWRKLDEFAKKGG